MHAPTRTRQIIILFIHLCYDRFQYNLLIFDEDPFSRSVYVMNVEKEMGRMFLSVLSKITGHLYSSCIFLIRHKKTVIVRTVLFFFLFNFCSFHPLGGWTAEEASSSFCTVIENNEPSIAALWIELLVCLCGSRVSERAEETYRPHPNRQFDFSSDRCLFDTYTIPCPILWHLVFWGSRRVFLRALLPFDDFSLWRASVWWEWSGYRHATTQSKRK